MATDAVVEGPYLCVLCRFGVWLDDAICATASGKCVCVRCFWREVEDERPFPMWLRREVAAAMAGT